MTSNAINLNRTGRATFAPDLSHQLCGLTWRVEIVCLHPRHPGRAIVGASTSTALQDVARTACSAPDNWL